MVNGGRLGKARLPLLEANEEHKGVPPINMPDGKFHKSIRYSSLVHLDKTAHRQCFVFF